MSDEFDITASRPEIPPPSSGAAASPSGEPTSSTSPARFNAGDVLAGRYRIVTRLGRGGMGEVYRADDLRLGQPVALKFLPPEWIDDEDRRERLRDEVRLARGVSHPRVCRVFDLDEIDHAAGRELCLAMELIDGEDLSSLLSRIGRLAPEKATDIGTQICAGLAAIHKAGVVHCDLKPANVMLDAGGAVRITDFGIAETGEAQATSGGTPGYMAPERLAGRGATVASDIYALGLVLYELYTGRKAFNASTVVELREKQAAGRVESMTSYAADLDPAIERVVSRCLDADPARRPTSAAQVALALPGGDPLQAALDAGETPSPELVAGSDARGRLHPLLAACLAVITVAAVGVFLQVSGRFSVTQFLPLEKHPIALVDDATGLLDQLGIELDAADEGYGYSDSTAYRRWLALRAETAPETWESLSEPRPAYVFFWYRASPGIYWRQSNNGFSRGFLEAGSPAWVTPGEVYVSLDLAGRLRRFYVIPNSGTDLTTASAPQAGDEQPWDDILRAAFRLAGLDLDAFEPTEPRYIHNHRTDRRFAWRGVYPESPGLELRVEAGAVDGGLSYFRFIPPWERPEFLQPATADEPEAAPAGSVNRAFEVAQRVRDLMNSILSRGSFIAMLGLILIAAVMTHRNIAARRVDLGSSIRLAVFAAIAVAVAKFISTDRLALTNQLEIIDCLAWGTFMGMGVWSGYAAVEPVIRRQHPRMLIAWTRLVDGRLRDPDVGRGVLLGMLSGVLIACAFRFGFLVQIAGDPAAPVNYWFRVPRPASIVIDLIIQAVVATITTFLLLVVLVGLRRVIRRDRLAIAFWIPAMAVFNDNTYSYSYSWMIALAVAAGMAMIYLKAGVLAAVVAVFVGEMLISLPVRADLTAWYAIDTRLGLSVLAAVLVWAWWVSSFGRTAGTFRG